MCLCCPGVEDRAEEEIAQCFVDLTILGPGSLWGSGCKLTALCPARTVGLQGNSQRWVHAGGLGVGRCTTVPALYDVGSSLGSRSSSLGPQISLNFSVPVTLLGGIMSRPRFQSLGSYPILATYGHVTWDRLSDLGVPQLLIYKMGIIFLFTWGCCEEYMDVKHQCWTHNKH